MNHDTFYHRLFAHRELVVELLAFLGSAWWVGAVDQEKMERVNTKYHGDKSDKREGDIVWRLPLKNKAEIYILLMLEFQSTLDRFMAVRMMAYLALLWQHLIREGKLLPDGRLPPVIPIVLYNGSKRWTSPKELAPLIGLPDEKGIQDWQPTLRYHLIDQKALAESGQLEKQQSLMALLFRLEQCATPEKLPPLLDEIVAWFQGHPSHAMLAPLVGALAWQMFAKHGIMETTVDVPDDLEEVKNMLSERIEIWKESFIQQGLERGLVQGVERGRQEGRREGRQEGRAIMLQELLEQKFGDLPDWVETRISVADLEHLEVWCRRVLEADSLEDVFVN